jgi:uncharacterized protein (TIGR00369 family)
MGGISLSDAHRILQNEFAPWVQALDLEIIETAERGCSISMPVAEHLYRQGGIVSGQAMMALADTSMVIAFSSYFGEFRPLATIDMNTSFLKPASKNIIAQANVIRAGRSICFAEATLSSEGKPVCRATGTYMLPPVGLK